MSIIQVDGPSSVTNGFFPDAGTNRVVVACIAFEATTGSTVVDTVTWGGVEGTIISQVNENLAGLNAVSILVYWVEAEFPVSNQPMEATFISGDHADVGSWGSRWTLTLDNRAQIDPLNVFASSELFAAGARELSGVGISDDVVAIASTPDINSGLLTVAGDFTVLGNDSAFSRDPLPNVLGLSNSTKSLVSWTPISWQGAPQSVGHSILASFTAANAVIGGFKELCFDRNNNLILDETDITIVIRFGLDGPVVFSTTEATTNAVGEMTIASAALVPGNTYVVTGERTNGETLAATKITAIENP